MSVDEGMIPSTIEDDHRTFSQIVPDVQGLIRALESTTTRRVHVRVGNIEIDVEREQPKIEPREPFQTLIHIPHAAGSADTSSSAGLLSIDAPLVGVFYRAPSPGAKPFVEIGDVIEHGQIIGIIEAMKMMNEVVSEHAGTVTDIVIRDGHAVQFAQPLVWLSITEVE